MDPLTGERTDQKIRLAETDGSKVKFGGQNA